MLVENEQAGLIVDDAHAPKKRQAVPGDSDPKGMWSPDTPISYYFDETISPDVAEKIRLSIQYYEENTCLSFAENATIKPRVKFFKGAGCYSTINKGTADRDRVISIGLGCTFFQIITHEIGHTLGKHCLTPKLGTLRKCSF
ncbi:CRE-NAS-28 protein [Aphelenchoides avenae]|nr:CRE-NAS-28 protein [Aphelenchus avenae]